MTWQDEGGSQQTLQTRQGAEPNLQTCHPAEWGGTLDNSGGRCQLSFRAQFILQDNFGLGGLANALTTLTIN